MFRHTQFRFKGITPNSSGIITHAQDNGSRTEVDNKVFINANVNPNETGLSTSFLAHKNNDSMSFSWNRMKVCVFLLFFWLNNEQCCRNHLGT